MATNILQYVGNLGKSITYSAVDQIKEMNPAVSEMMELNADLVKTVYESVKDYKGTVKRAKDFVIQSDVGEAAIQMKKSIIEDLKTGKFYNRQRIDEMDVKASGGLLDFSDMDSDPFAGMDDDGSWNFDDFNEDDWSADLDDQYLAESMDATGEKITKGVAEATFRSADYIVASNKKNSAMMQKHNEFLANKINVSIGSVSSGVAQLIEFNNTNMATHINNSQKFYDFATNNLGKQLELLEAISKNTAFGAGPQAAEQKKSEKIGYDDIVGAEGMPDLKQYFSMVKQNIDDITGGLTSLNKSMGGNMLMTLAGSPLKVVTDTLVKKIIPATTKDIMKGINESMSGVFSSLMMKAEYASQNSESEFVSKLAQLLGVNLGVKTSINTSKYNRGPMPFDGETKMAIMNTSQQLGKIISILSGKSEQIFDYNAGKWISYDSIKENYGVDKLTKRNAESASSELRDLIKEMTSRTDFVDVQDKKKFQESLDNMFLEAYRNGGLFGFNGKDFNEFARRMGIDYDSIKYIKPLLDMIEKENRSKLLTYNNNIYRQRQSQKRTMENLENSPSAIERILYTNYNGDEFVNRGKDKNIITNPYDLKDGGNNPIIAGGQGLITVKDNNGKNVFDYLKKTIYELEYIRRNGLPGGYNGGGHSMYLGGTNSPREIIEPEPFKDESYIRNHKTKEEHNRKNSADEQKKYDRERSQIYKSYIRETSKGRVSYNPIFNAVEDFSTLPDGHDYDDEMKLYRRYLENRSEEHAMERLIRNNKEKQEKIEKMPGWIQAFMKEDAVDERVKTFMTGVYDLSQKPAEFLSRMVERTDKALYEAIYGNEKEDRLTTKSFMGQLLARMTSTFANFGDFMKQDILDPLKRELFGEDSVPSGIVKKVKDKLNLDTDKIEGSIKDFLLGSYQLDENGNKVLDENGNPIRLTAGMLGGKIDYVKKNMRDVYRTPIAYLKGKPKDPEQLRLMQIENQMIAEQNASAKRWIELNDVFHLAGDEYWDENNNAIAQEQRVGGMFVSARDRLQAPKTKEERIARMKEEYKTNQKQRAELKAALKNETDPEMKQMILEELQQLSQKQYGNSYYNNQIFDNNTNKKRHQSIKNKKKADREANRSANKYKQKQAEADRLAQEQAEREKQEQLQRDIRKGRAPRPLSPAHESANVFIENDTPNAYTGGYVQKTGIAAVSEGELIIPSELNPFYNEIKTKAQQRAKENSAKRDFIKYINGVSGSNYNDIPGYSEGTLPNGTAKVIPMTSARETKTQANKQKQQSSSDDAAAAAPIGQILYKDIHNLRDQYIEGEESIGYKLGDEVKNLFGFFSAIGLNKNNVKERLSNSSEVFASAAEKISNQMEEATASGQDSQVLYQNMIKDVKGDFSKYFPQLLGGGLVGAGVSLVTGAVGGPLLGAAIGAATDLVVSSGGVRDWLFGEYGNDGKRKGNVISKDLANNIEKYFPDMAKGAVVGGITSILPFVPGGPVAGIILGSSIGFAKNNDKIQKYLFGDELSEGVISKQTQETIKKAVPAALLGAGIGAFVGPFGFVGNILAGSAIGFASKTNAFHDFLFGKKNEDGEIEGGVVNTIKTGFVDPLLDFGGSVIDRVHKWFVDDIATPVSKAIMPITKQGKLIITKIIGGITGKVGDIVEKEMTSLKMPLSTILNEKILKPAGRLAKGTLNAAAFPAGRIISSPFRFLGMIGDINRAKHVASGNADYMTAAERLRYREEVSNGVEYERYKEDERDPETGALIHRKGEFKLDENGETIVKKKRRFGLLNDLTTGRRARKDKFREFDEMLVNTDVDSLKEMSNAIGMLQNPNKQAKKQRMNSAQIIKHALSGKVPYNVQNKILQEMENGDFDEAMASLRRSGIDPSEMRGITQLLTQEYSNYQASQDILNDEGGARNRLYKRLKKLGLKDISDKNLDKYKGLLDQEINNKPDEKSEIEKLNENQNNRHNEIVDLFRNVIDELKMIRDPKYAEEVATKRFQRNMFEARKRRGIFRYSDRGDSGLFGNFEYKAKLGEDGKLHYYRIDSDGNQQLVDEKGRVINEDGSFVDFAEDDAERNYDESNIRNTADRNGLDYTGNTVLNIINAANRKIHNIENAIGRGVHRAWNGATYEEKAQARHDKNEHEQAIWKQKCINANLTIPENYTGSYKDLWMTHFRGVRNLTESEDNDTKYVPDSEGNPVKWVKNSEGQWEISNNDSQNKQYLTKREKFSGIVEGLRDDIKGIGKTVASGFLNLFNIDKERDGWLKSTVKIGTGILGALTVVGFGPILEHWVKETAAPAVHRFWDNSIAPKLGKLIEPIKPTIAKAAAGVDSVIRAIPNAIDSLGNKITNFFKFTFPDLLTNKIIPFYQNGINWLIDKTGWIVEKATTLAWKILPKVISGVIKGSWEFMKNDIFTLFAGQGRRDAKSLLAMTSKSPSKSTTVQDSTVGQKMSNFHLFSNLYKDVTGETPEQTLGVQNPSVTELESYYSGKTSTLPTVRYSTIENNSARSAVYPTEKSSSNNYAPFSGSYNPSDYEAYSAYTASAGNTNNIDGSLIRDYDKDVKGYNKQQSTNTTSTTFGIANWNKMSMEEANAPYVANDYSNGYDPFGPTVDPQEYYIQNASEVIDPSQFIIDDNGYVYDIETGNQVGFWDRINDIFATDDSHKAKNNSIANLLSGQNQSIASRMIKASGRAFATGSSSVLTRGLSNFGRNSFLLNRTLPGKIVKKSINSSGRIIERAGGLGRSIRRIASGHVAPGSFDNLYTALTQSSARNAVSDTYNHLVQEALNSRYSPTEAADWARLNFADREGSTTVQRIYENMYGNMDEMVETLDHSLGKDIFRSNLSGNATSALKNSATQSVDDIIEGVARSSSQEAAERAIAGVRNATTSTGLLSSLRKKLSAFFKRFTKDGIIKKYFRKALQASGQQVTDEAVEAGLRTLTREGEEALITTFGSTVTKSGVKVLKALGEWLPFVSIAFAIKDFYDGFTKGAAWLGILDEDCPIWAKFACGVAQLINGKFTLGLIPISILVDLFVNILAPMFAIDMEAFNNLRNIAGQQLDEFNEKNGTNLTLEQYNNRHNFISRGWERVKSLFTGKYIYDNISEVGAHSAEEQMRNEVIYGDRKKRIDTSFGNAVGAGSGIAEKYNSMLGIGNDKTLICQNNPAYAKLRFNSNKDTKYQTLGDSGCGPAAAAMVINAINDDKTVDIKDAANYAIQDNTKAKDSGVDARFFNDYYAKNNIQAEYVDGAPAIIEMIRKTKNPVVLLGQDEHNTNKMYSPFGAGNHYVVANRISGNTIYINDPEQPKANIPYSISILNKVKLGIGATKGLVKKRSIPTKYASYNGAGNNIPKFAIGKSRNRVRPLSYYAGRGSDSRSEWERVSTSGTTVTQYENRMKYKEMVENGTIVTGDNVDLVSTDPSRSTCSINEIISAIMVVYSSLNLATINLNGDKDGNISVGIMQWSGTDASKLLNSILSKNESAGKNILGQSSKLYKSIQSKTVIYGKDLTPNSRNRLTTFLSTLESKEVQIEEARKLAVDLTSKSPFKNAKSTIFWCAVYRYNQLLAEKIEKLVGNDLDKACGVGSVYDAMKNFSEYNTDYQKYALLYSFVASSPCVEISNQFDTMAISNIVTVNEDSGSGENNFLSQIFEKILDIGKAYFGIGNSAKEYLLNSDNSLGASYENAAEVFNIDQGIIDTMSPYIDEANNSENLLIDRLRAINKMISIDKYAGICLAETYAKTLFDYLSGFKFFQTYLDYGMTDADNQNSSTLSSKASLLNPDSIVSSVKAECLEELNKYDYSQSQDMMVTSNENFEDNAIYGLFRTQIDLFEAIGGTKDAASVRWQASRNRTTGVITYDKRFPNAKGKGAFDNEFFNCRLINCKEFVDGINKLNTRKSIISYLENYLKNEFLDAINRGDFYSVDDVTRSELRNALKILSSDEYSLDAKEKAWDDAEAILTTSYVNNPNIDRQGLIGILNQFPTKDFDYMKSPDYKVNTNLNSANAEKNTGFSPSSLDFRNIQSNINGINYLNQNKVINNGYLLSSILGPQSDINPPMLNKVNLNSFKSSSTAINPYTAQKLTLRSNIANMGKIDINESSTGSTNAITTFINLAKLRWLYKTNQGATDAFFANGLGRITHPTGPRNYDKVHEKYRDSIAEFIAMKGDDKSINRRVSEGKLIQGMKKDYSNNNWLDQWLQFYNIWKSDPNQVGGPFINGYKFNKEEYFKAVLDQRLHPNNSDYSDAATLQALIGNEILGDTTVNYTNSNESPLDKKYSKELAEYMDINFKEEDVDNIDKKSNTSSNINNTKNNGFMNNFMRSMALNPLGIPLIGPVAGYNIAKKYGKVSTDTESAKGSFVSQYDYGNKTFSDGESLSTAGCGPAVASMILGSAGSSTTPLMDYTAAVADKYKDQGGTNATYFNDILGRAGMSTQYIQNNIKNGIESSLNAGQQVVVMGRDSSNDSKSNSPFGPGNHYVLATGLKNGKVAINDPEQSGPRIYPKRILNNAKLGVAVAKGSLIAAYKYSAKGTNWNQSQLLNQDLKLYGANSMTAQQMNDYIRSKHPDSFWNGWGETIIKASEVTGLDPRYLLAHALQEVGWRPSHISTDKHNFFGIGAVDSDPYNQAYSWNSDEEGFIQGAIWIEKHYYQRGQTTIYKMRFNGGSHEYCTDTNWANAIAEKWATMPASLVGPGQNPGGTGVYTGVDAASDGNSSTSNSWLDRITAGIERAGKAYFGISTGNSGDTFYNNQYASTGNSIIDMARRYIGVTPYVTGGTDLINGADCSGFTSAIYKSFGVEIPRTANAQYTNQAIKSINDQSQLIPGDLVFFSSNGGKTATHVGIYSGNNSYIHSSQPGEKVKESQFSANDGYIGAKRYSEKILSAGSSGIMNRINNFVSGKGSSNTGKQKLVKQLAHINRMNNNVANNISHKGKEIISTHDMLSSLKSKIKTVKVTGNSSAGASGTIDAGVIYESLATIIKLLDKTATNTAYNAKVAELIEVANSYLDQLSKGGASAKGSESTTNQKQTSKINRAKNIKTSKSFPNAMEGTHTKDEMAKLETILNRFKAMVSN